MTAFKITAWGVLSHFKTSLHLNLLDRLLFMLQREMRNNNTSNDHLLISQIQIDIKQFNDCLVVSFADFQHLQNK